MKLEELAKLAGVSRTTASYVVNGKAKQYRVSDKTIEKVQALIKEYDFKPNAMAAGLRAGKSNTIGLIIPDFENLSYAKIANQLEKSCRENGYQLLITCSNDNVANELECAKHLFQRQVDALFVSTVLPADNHYYQQNNAIPIIGFDRHIDSEGVDNVLTDDKHDAYELAVSLFDKADYQRILFLGALPELPMSKAREEGFKQALGKKQLQVDYLYASQFRKENAEQLVSEWIEKNGIVPDAIFSTSLTLLQGLLMSFIKRNEAFPKDLVIATFGWHEMLELLENKIVCSVQDHSKVVQALLDLALHKMRIKKLKQLHPVIQRRLAYHNWQ
ncbi:catabolite repressor/activator [Basfia succiniciproducens]|uniref:catabolite repressor/activator n=1 Tax=Basfia succiniciproducens TaxID=653940 RepID=UPI003FCC96F3